MYEKRKSWLYLSETNACLVVQTNGYLMQESGAITNVLFRYVPFEFTFHSKIGFNNFDLPKYLCNNMYTTIPIYALYLITSVEFIET